MPYQLHQLIDMPGIEKMLHSFHRVSGMVGSILDMEGNILLAVDWQDICLKFHRVCPQTECRCRQSDNYFKEHLQEKPYLVYKCLNGLVDCAIPIIVDNHHLGTFFTGQFLSEPPDEEFFRQQAIDFGFEEQAYIEALRQVPVIGSARVEAIMDFYTDLVQMISAMGLQRMQQLEAMDEKVRLSEQRLRLALEGSSTGFWDWDTKTQSIFRSPSWYKMLGYAEGEIDPSITAWEKLTHPQDRAYVSKRINDHIEGHTPQYDAQYRILTKDGQWKWVQATGKAAQWDEHHRALRISGLTTDIDERKWAEKQLQEERNFNAALLDIAGNLIIVTDQDGRIVIFNQVCEQISGYSLQDVEGKYIWEIFSAEDNDEIKSFYDYSELDWQQPIPRREFENCWLSKAGDPRLISWNITYLHDENGNDIHVIGTGTDITNSRAMEVKLSESEAQLRSLFDNANGIIYTLSPEGALIFVSPGWTESLGHDIANVTGNSFEVFVHPDDIHLCRQFLAKVLATGQPQKGVEYRVRHLDGSWRWHTSGGALVKDEAGNILHYVGLAVDITEQKLATDIRQEHERRFRNALENAQLVTAMLDTENRITFCNDFMLQRLDWEREELIGRDWFDTLVPAELQERDRAIFKRRLARRTPSFFGESQLLAKSGGRRSMLWNNTILFNPDGSSAGLAIIGEDVTERRAARERTYQLMQELEAANRELKDFAYIVSHDLKAPLRGIRSLAEWISADYQEKLDAAGQEMLALLLNRTARMHNLLEGILTYSRLSQPEESTRIIDLSEVVAEVIELLAPPSHIAIVIDTELPQLALDRTRITQLFENLISNAVKYMDKPQGMIRISAELAAGYWQISIADNGPGIDEKYFDKIFAIFQTLKPRDEFESTGIGLTIVKKIVTRYGGRVWVESQPGQGSTFHVTLPTEKIYAEGDSHAH